MAPLRGRSTSQEGDANPPQATLQPDKVVASRKGEVLIKYTILKSDHFPGAWHLPRFFAGWLVALGSTEFGMQAFPCLAPLNWSNVSRTSRACGQAVKTRSCCRCWRARPTSDRRASSRALFQPGPASAAFL